MELLYSEIDTSLIFLLIITLWIFFPLLHKHKQNSNMFFISGVVPDFLKFGLPTIAGIGIYDLDSNLKSLPFVVNL